MRERRLAGVFPCLLGLLAVFLPAGTPLALDTETAVAGLKEALGVGSTRAVDILGQVDGYLGNDDVRVPMPEKLKTVEKGLKMFGAEHLVDEFVISMNRAAEAAAPLATEVFLDTIKGMSFKDARRIVGGTEHEATDYLRENAGGRLEELFLPIVDQQLETVGTTKALENLMASASRNPLTSGLSFDLPDYVTGKALDGMFLMISREEEKIRDDPGARTTELLKKVFGGDDGGKKKPWWKRAFKGEDSGG